MEPNRRLFHPVAKRASRRLNSIERIFLADDDLEMRRVVAEVLSAQGYDIIEAGDSTQLIANLLAAQLDPALGYDAVDLILTDERMPGLSGLDVIAMLRDANWETPAIVMTAFADHGLQARAAALGTVLLEKPFRLGLLQNAVRTCLRTFGRGSNPF